MTKISDYINKGAKKFTDLEDAPNILEPNKYLKVSQDGNLINMSDVQVSYNDVSLSGSENLTTGFTYKFDTNISGSPSSGYIQVDSSNYAAATKLYINKNTSYNTELSTWLDSWDDSTNAVKGNAVISSKDTSGKFLTFKVTGIPVGFFGSGADGDVTINSNYNINTDIMIGGRSYADGVVYNCTSVGSSSVQTSATPNGISAGDTIILINLQGTPTNYVNVGNYELLTVNEINGSIITFTENKSKYYGDNENDDTNIGTSSSNQRVIIQRVPQFNDLTINNGVTVTANTWDGAKGGIVVFKVAGIFTNNGVVDVNYKGFRGGTDYNYPGYVGEGINLSKDVTRDSTGGIGGGGCGPWSGGYGYGGSYGTNGNSGSGSGSTYGESTLSKMFLGSAGGGGTRGNGSGQIEGSGGNGGGIIYIISETMKNYGTISSKGHNGYVSWDGADGGPGTGGSIVIKASNLYNYSSTVTAIGGTAPNTGRIAGTGRIAYYYENIFDVLSTNPTAYEDDEWSPSGNADVYTFTVNRLMSGSNFNDDENVLLAYTFNY